MTDGGPARRAGAGLPGYARVHLPLPQPAAAREAALERGDYNGVFLDRARYLSPTADPSRWLACFCDDCHRAATAAGLDLQALWLGIRRLLATPERLELVGEVWAR